MKPEFPAGPRPLLSARVSGMTSAATIAMSQRAAAMRAQGIDVISMAVGEPDFATPARIVEAAHAAAQRGFTRYTAADGSPLVKEAVRRKLQRENGLAYSHDEIHVGSGAKQVIHNAFASTLDPGDEVIVFAPCWVSYIDIIEFCGGRAVVVPTSPQARFAPDPGLLRAAITPRTKWVLLNSPNNPTGAVYPRQVLEGIVAELSARPDILVMADEIYEHLVYGVPHVSVLDVAPQLRERVLLVNGVSKTYSMTGWRIGFAAGPAVLVEAMGRVQSQTTGSSCSVSQAAAAEAMDGDQSEVAGWVATFRRRRDRALAVLARSERVRVVKPDGAFYLFLDVSRCVGARTPDGSVLADDVALVEHLLNTAHVAAVPGEAFAMPGYLRLSFALEEDRLAQGCERIADVLDRLELA